MQREKEIFDSKLQRGRFATVVKRQEYYGSVIKILEDADRHMKSTLKEATTLLQRVV